MWQIVFGIVFRLESAYILSLIEGKQPNRIIFLFWLTLSSHVLSLSSSHRLWLWYHASETTSLRNEVANVQRCVTFVTQRPLCGDKMRWGQTTSHRSRFFCAAVLSHSRGRVLNFDCISFCDDMPAWVIAAYSWICNDGQRFLSFWQDFYHSAFKSNPIWGIQNEKRLFYLFWLVWMQTQQTTSVLVFSTKHSTLHAKDTIYMCQCGWCTKFLIDDVSAWCNIKWADLIFKMTTQNHLRGMGMEIEKDTENIPSESIHSKYGEPYGNSYA